MAEPLLHLDERHSLTDQQVGAAMAEIMEPNRPQVMPIQKTGKLPRHIVGLDDVTFLIDADVVALLRTTCLLDFQEQFFDGRYQRHCTEACRPFELILR